MTDKYQSMSPQLLQQTLDATIDNDATLSTYESNFRCSICYDFIKTALTIDVCSHTYCSLCIRRSLYFIQRCPTCLAQCNSNNLHTNRTVDLLIQQYNAFKQQLVKTLSRQLLSVLPKQTVIDIDTDANNTVDNNHTNTKQSNGILNLFSKHPSSNKRQKLNKVECPVCYTPVVESQINIHLDTCLGVPMNAHKAETQTPTQTAHDRITAQLPVYNLLKDKQIKDLLKQHNLPTHGDRDALIRRHREFMLCYISEHDSVTPASKEEIVRDLVKKEQKQQSNISNRLGKQATLLDAFASKEMSTVPVRNSKHSNNKKWSSSKPNYNNDIIVLDDMTSTANSYMQPQPSPTLSITSDDTAISAHNDTHTSSHTLPSPTTEQPSADMNVDLDEISSDDESPHPNTQAEMFSHLIAQYKRKQRHKQLSKQRLAADSTTSAPPVFPATIPTITPTPAPVPTESHTITTPIVVPKTESQSWRAIYHDKLQRVFYYNTMSHIGQFEKPDTYVDTK